MLTTILAYVLVALFLGLEGRMRQGETARGLERGTFDRESTHLLGTAFAITLLALLLAPVLNYFQIGRLAYATFVGWGDLVLMLLGLTLRVWANKALGDLYTRTLQVTAQRVLVKRGLYKLIRHPGYLGTLLMWVGAGWLRPTGLSQFS